MKKLKNIEEAKKLIIYYIENGYRDNAELFKIIKRQFNTGLTSGELSRLIYKYTEEALLGDTNE
tara:strand:- start:635 stop:826 length:192 start_codon:yes stop_codon:yes gene_type:complete